MIDTLDLRETALVIIDLQKGIVNREGFAPFSVNEVIEKNEKLAASLVNTDALIVAVHVKNYGPEVLTPIVDKPLKKIAPSMDYSDFVIGVVNDPESQNVIQVVKHNWGAFYGTDLEVQLRRRGIKTIILTGIATTIGCDTTAREAFQRGFNVITVPDAMTDFSVRFHEATVKYIFNRMGRVRSTEEVLESIMEAK
ncbi:MAG TPA: isochorismatase family protein [Lactovum miscens]|uniref:isochorismatase family protein n=1 Tax=Lactovum miscens TaxID=190387 RepID=UPI002ED8C42C